MSILARTALIVRASVRSSITSTSLVRSFTTAATVAPSGPCTPVKLHALDFPFLKQDPALSHHDHSRGTSVADAPLIILHGLLGSAGNWRTTAPKLSSHRRILSLDVRNHGSSPHVEDMRFGSCAADVMQLMDDRGIDKAIVMGHSLGGKIAMATGLLHPDRVVSVISVDMSPQDYNLTDDGWTGVSRIVEACALVPIQQMRSRSEVDTFLKSHIPDFTTRAFVLQNVVVHTTTDANGEKQQTVGWRCNLDTLHRSLRLIAGFDIQAPIKPYPNPALFIGGGKSPYLTDKQRPIVNLLFPNNEWVTIPDAGHWVHVEKPKEFVEIVRNYLKKLEKH